jgi:undecaprenyl-diphosphatase
MTLRKSWVVALAGVAAAVYLAMWIGYGMQWRWLATLDASALNDCYRYGAHRPGWVSFWNALCTVLGPTAFRIVALVLAVIALLSRAVRTALFLAVSVGLSGLVTVAAKAAADRARPATALVSAPGSSFPSGHALEVMAGVLALCVVLFPMVRGSLRPCLITIGAVVVVAVGVGRVVLNVHYPSDVVAGWSLGYLWFAASLPILAPQPARATTVAEPLLDP